MKIIFTLVLVSNILLTTYAQNSIKIGYTNAEYILSLLPEAKQIESNLKSFETQLKNQLEAKYKNLQTKISDYQRMESTYNDVIKADKQSEIQNMQQNIQEFQVNAESSLVKKRDELLKPAFEKIGSAIKKVAEQNNFTFIFSIGTPGMDILLYAQEQHDVTNLVLKNLSITPPPKNTK